MSQLANLIQRGPGRVPGWMVLIAWMGLGLSQAETVSKIGLSASESTEVIQLLRSAYADPSIIKDKKLTPGSLDEVLTKLQGGVALMSQPSTPSTNVRSIRTELLPYNIGYWRLSSFRPANGWTALDTQLGQWDRAGVIGLVLDVRDFETGNDYAGAALAASLFVPPGLNLFSVQGMQTPQQFYQNTRRSNSFHRPIIVLTNRHTTGAAEAFAVVMRNQAKAILVGRSTAGQEGLYTENRLSSGRYLRMATAQAVLGDGTKLFGIPIQPDIALSLDDQKESEILLQESQAQVSKAVQELPARPRLNEAALVHEQNPEYDEVYAEQQRQQQGDSAPVFEQDFALVRALDVLRAIQYSQATSGTPAS